MNPLSRRTFLGWAGASAAAGGLAEVSGVGADSWDADVCVYGATASGVAAAMSAADAGARVMMIEPSRWLGGMSGGGLSAIDWGNRRTVGGMARKLLLEGDDPGMRELYGRELTQRGIPVLFEHRLGGVTKEDGWIRSIALDHAPPDGRGCPIAKPRVAQAKVVKARVFIDCSYEGDLMAQAGVSYTWGRESRDEYGETLAGVRPALARYAIDPYIKPGEARSGLLPLLQDVAIGPLGSADKLTMAYAFRWHLASKDDPIRIEAPEDYDPRTYEIFRRGFLQGVDMRKGQHLRKLGEPAEARGYGIFGGNSSRALWAQSVAGENRDYPDGDWGVRSRIWGEQMRFVAGMYHFLRTDPSVPEEFRVKAETIGFRRGVFDETQGWPHQLYVREARRMKAAYIVTQKDLEGTNLPDDPVGLGSYGVDDWPYATVADQGGIALSGGEFSILNPNPAGTGVFPIPYRAIVPIQAQCGNLLVPVCCSASHIAMTSLRMEPVWITLGQSAGIAAAHSIAQGVAVQEIDRARLHQALLEAGQVLSFDPSKQNGWDSREEWDRDKPGYEKLFPVIDKDADGRISPSEYREYQATKRKKPEGGEGR